jgi:hypothetical protein
MALEVTMKSSFTKGAAGEPTTEVASTESAPAEVTAASTAHVNSATPAASKG